MMTILTEMIINHVGNLGQGLTIKQWRDRYETIYIYSQPGCSAIAMIAVDQIQNQITITTYNPYQNHGAIHPADPELLTKIDQFLTK